MIISLGLSEIQSCRSQKFDSASAKLFIECYRPASGERPPGAWAADQKVCGGAPHASPFGYRYVPLEKNSSESIRWRFQTVILTRYFYSG